jgi:hypothetical protein
MPFDSLLTIPISGTQSQLPYFPAYNARVIYTKKSKIVKIEHARYTLERFPTDNARVICTKKGIGKYGIMY